MSGLKPIVSSHDHLQGNADAPLELVEYGDYQCPHCGRAYPLIKKLQKKLGNNLKFVFRNFPLSEAHPQAMHAAVAAEAAGAQHKFWQMHDIIYEHQQRLDDASLMQYAAKIGMDAERFAADFEKNEYTEKVEADFESGIRSGVNGTPCFFINGKKYEGDWEDDALEEHLQSLL